MTPEAQRIAIAEACGFRNVCESNEWHHWPGYVLIGNESSGMAVEIPDYISDLNAMHQAEKMLKNTQFGLYTSQLLDVVAEAIPTEWNFYLLHATAAQRAEAFLKTLNLWTGGKDVNVGNLTNGGN